MKNFELARADYFIVKNPRKTSQHHGKIYVMTASKNTGERASANEIREGNFILYGYHCNPYENNPCLSIPTAIEGVPVNRDELEIIRKFDLLEEFYSKSTKYVAFMN